MSQWLHSGHRVTVLNCFTRSLYAPFSDADSIHDNDRLSYVSAMRRHEDEDLLKHLKGLRMVDLNLKDAPVRLRCPAETVCDIPPDPNDHAVAKIEKALAAQVLALKIDALVLPLGIGHHVDHAVVRDACLASARSLPTAFYEDLPYATAMSFEGELKTLLDEIAERVARLAAVTVRVPGGVELKQRLTLLYNSQVDKDTAHAISKFAARYDEGERLWVTPSWLDLTPALATQQVKATSEISSEG